MNKISIKNGIGISGKVTVKRYRAGMVEMVTPFLEILKSLNEYKNGKGQFAGVTMSTSLFENLVNEVKAKIETIKAEYFIEVAVENKNLVMDSPGYGLDLVIQRLVGINTYSLNILWGEIGTGTTAPTVNDTALVAPTNRGAVSFQEDYAATDAIVQFYFTDAALTNTTYGEFGTFVDGTSTIGTGRLFNRVALSPTYTKVSGQDTTVEVDFTIVNA
jgi:hypothetical protein